METTADNITEIAPSPNAPPPDKPPRRKVSRAEKRDQVTAATATMTDRWEAPMVEPPPLAHRVTLAAPADPQALWTPVRSRKDPYRTPCPDCPAMMMLPMPTVHCVKCHKVWSARILTMPVRCPDCGYNLFRWRALNGIAESRMLSVLR